MFKNPIILLTLVSLLNFLLGCGVKTDPTPPPGTHLPSYMGKVINKMHNNFKEKQKLNDKRI